MCTATWARAGAERAALLPHSTLCAIAETHSEPCLPQRNNQWGLEQLEPCRTSLNDVDNPDSLSVCCAVYTLSQKGHCC